MNNSNSIVLLAANASFSHSSLALRYLAGCLEGNRWRPTLIECTTRDNPESVINRILECDPRVLATTMYLFNREFLVGLTREFKRRAPGALLICGGPEFLGDNRALLKSMSHVDAAIRGEGELAWKAVVDRLDEPEAWIHVSGVCCFRAGAYIDNGTAVIVKDLDRLPSPYREFPPGPNKPFAQLETSRGCSNECSFCTSAGTGPVRTVSIDRIRREIEHLRGLGLQKIRLVDRTFNEKPRRTNSLLRMFRNDFSNMEFHLEIDPARLSRSTVAEMKAAPEGNLHIEAGVQSLSNRALGNIRRRCTSEKTLLGLSALCGMRNLTIHADLIAGLPGMDMADLHNDLDTLSRLGPAEIQVEVLKILPGTPLASEANDFGIRWSESPPYVVLSTPGMTPERIREAKRLSVLVDRFYNARALRPVVMEAVRGMKSFWREILPEFKTVKSLEAVRSLEKRFVFLDEFLQNRCSRARDVLHFEWMRKGLSARSGICSAVPVRNGIPSGARLIEGDPSVPVARAYRLKAGDTFIFAYGSGRTHGRVSAIYQL